MGISTIEFENVMDEDPIPLSIKQDWRLSLGYGFCYFKVYDLGRVPKLVRNSDSAHQSEPRAYSVLFRLIPSLFIPINEVASGVNYMIYQQ